MKIIRFSVREMHGYYNFDLEFNHQINFLVGVNGSGKTSALRLMQAALTFDLSVLATIAFSRISIEIEDGERYMLTIFNHGKFLQFKLNGADANIKVPLPGDDEKIMYQSHGRYTEFMEDQRLRFLREAGRIFREFGGINRPLFLGLERRLGRYDEEFHDSADDEIFLKSRRIKNTSREIIEGIDNCQIIIEGAYRKFRRVADLSYSRLIRFIVTSLFDYIEFDPSSWSGNQFSRDQLQGLFDRRNELEKFAKDLTGLEDHPQISLFFDKVSAVLKYGKVGKGDALNLELLLNKAQLQRIFKILEEIDSQKKNSEKHYAPIKNWADSINSFLSQSGKKVEVDSVGKIKVTHGGKNISLEHLSSGEKQLIILLTHARFSKRAGGAIIVDEPELSLHLHWQEMLVDSLTHDRQENQFIFATHSPEIVGFRKNFCIQMG